MSIIMISSGSRLHCCENNWGRDCTEFWVFFAAGVCRPVGCKISIRFLQFLIENHEKIIVCHVKSNELQYRKTVPDCSAKVV